MKRILVTGGAGYVGSVLVPKLLARGYRVRVLDSLMYRQTSLIPFCLHDGLEFMRGDIRDEGAVNQAVDGVDCIVHLAAIVGAPACARDTRTAQEVNYEATSMLSRCIHRIGDISPVSDEEHRTDRWAIIDELRFHRTRKDRFENV